MPLSHAFLTFRTMKDSQFPHFFGAPTPCFLSEHLERKILLLDCLACAHCDAVVPFLYRLQ
jgi:hypothetical protein